MDERRRPTFGSLPNTADLHQGGVDHGLGQAQGQRLVGPAHAHAQHVAHPLAVAHDVLGQAAADLQQAPPELAPRRGRLAPRAEGHHHVAGALVAVHADAVEAGLGGAGQLLPQGGAGNVQVGEQEHQHGGQVRLDHPGPLGHPEDRALPHPRPAQLGPGVRGHDRPGHRQQAAALQARGQAGQGGAHFGHRQAPADDPRGGGQQLALRGAQQAAQLGSAPRARPALPQAAPTLATLLLISTPRRRGSARRSRPISTGAPAKRLRVKQAAKLGVGSSSRIRERFIGKLPGFSAGVKVREAVAAQKPAGRAARRFSAPRYCSPEVVGGHMPASVSGCRAAACKASRLGYLAARRRRSSRGRWSEAPPAAKRRGKPVRCLQQEARAARPGSRPGR